MNNDGHIAACYHHGVFKFLAAKQLKPADVDREVGSLITFVYSVNIHFVFIRN
jgi:hypothetical protein